MKGPVDHKRRKGSPYEPKPPVSEDLKRQISESLKEFNRKSGKITLLGNVLARRRRKPK